LIEIKITSNQIWTVPDDWSSTNIIEIVGGGGGGGNAIAKDTYPNQIRQWRNYSRAGASGGYVRVENVNILQPKQLINLIVGQGGLAADSYRFNMPSNQFDINSILSVTGRPGQQTIFGNYMSVYGGRYLLEYIDFPKLYSHIGGTLNFNNWPIGSYSNLVTIDGQSRRYIPDAFTVGDLQVVSSNALSFQTLDNWPELARQFNFEPGQGGQGMTLVNNYLVWGNRFLVTGGINPAEVTKFADNGKQGVIRIRYQPSYTQQACVWIS